MSELYIVGGTVLTMGPKDDVVENATIHVRDGRIVSVGRSDGAPPVGKRVVDARGCLVLPGLVNGHTHVGMTLLRGFADDLPLGEWLRKAVFPTERQWGSPEFVGFGALLASLELIRGGATTANDMYYFELEAARSFHQAGLRAVAGLDVNEISGVGNDPDSIVAAYERYLSDVAGLRRILPAISPHSVYGLSEPLWKRAIAFAEEKNVFVFTHLSETAQENRDCVARYGKSPTRVFEQWGLWERCRAGVAHGVYLDNEDIEVLARHRVGVVHNPQSNMKLDNWTCPVVELRRAGVPVGLGTDGAGSNNNLDLLEEADTAAKLAVQRMGSGALPARAIVRMLTIEGAKALRLDDQIGSLEPGKCADIIAVDVRKPHAQPLYDPFSHLVYSAHGSDVKHTIVDGDVLMESYRVLSIDEEAILNEAEAWGKRIGVTLPPWK